MSDKVMNSATPSGPAESGQTGQVPGGPTPDGCKAGGAQPAGTLPEGNALRPVRVLHEDGITNPRDGRGPLRRRDDQAAKLPLRPPH